MPTIRHVDGATPLVHDAFEGPSTYGDEHDVSEAAAEYLCDERGDFERIVPAETADGGEGDADAPDVDPEHVEACIEDGVCPFCDDYEGEGVPQHAGSSHPDLWAAYKEH